MRGKLIDLTGQRFGRLTVVRRADYKYKMTAVVWVCRCDCGNMKDVTSSNLRNGNTSSCGCYAQEIKSETARRGAEATKAYHAAKQNMEKRPKDRYIHPDGYVALVNAIIRQARKDLMESSPKTAMRRDVKQFFLSEYFQGITGMDGREVYNRLLKDYYSMRR